MMATMLAMMPAILMVPAMLAESLGAGRQCCLTKGVWQPLPSFVCLLCCML